MDLMQELADKIRFIVDNKLTERQKVVIQKIYYEGKTQTEAAQELGIVQPSVHKSLLGNLIYLNNFSKEPHKRYGGAFKKIRKICDNDAEIQNILNKIEKLKLELMEDGSV